MTTPTDVPILLWLTDQLDADGTLEFNVFYSEHHVQANQVDLKLFRESPWETMDNFVGYGAEHHAKVSVGVNLRRKGIAPKVRDGLKYDGFGVKADIIQCAAFFQDADLPDSDVDLQSLIDYTPSPSVIVSSSPGRYHAYWKLSAPLDITCADDIARYEGVQKGIANYFGFKPMNIRQVMGLPGSFNFKYDPPTLRQVVYFDEHAVYGDWGDFPSVSNQRPIHDYDLEVYHDGEIPKDAIDQLRNPVGRHGGRSNAIFAVAVWLRDLEFSQSDVMGFIVNQCRSLAIYNDFPNRSIESAVKSAYRS